VVLRGLTIKGAGGDYGIRFTSGAALHVEHCVINMRIGFTGSNGILSDSAGELFCCRYRRKGKFRWHFRPEHQGLTRPLPSGE
jgi:hypothetical protein